MKLSEGDLVTTREVESAFYSGYASGPEVFFEPGMAGVVAHPASPSVRYGPGRQDTLVIVDFDTKLPDGSGKQERVSLWPKQVAPLQLIHPYEALKQQVRCQLGTNYDPALPAETQWAAYLVERAVMAAFHATNDQPLDFDFAWNARHRLDAVWQRGRGIKALDTWRGCHPDYYPVEQLKHDLEQLAALFEEITRLKILLKENWPTRKPVGKVTLF